MKLTVAAFVQNKAEQSNKLAQVNRILRLQSVPVADSVDNSKLFDAGTPGSVSLDMSGASPEILAAFSAGASVTLTIDTGS